LLFHDAEPVYDLFTKGLVVLVVLIFSGGGRVLSVGGLLASPEIRHFYPRFERKLLAGFTLATR